MLCGWVRVWWFFGFGMGVFEGGSGFSVQTDLLRVFYDFFFSLVTGVDVIRVFFSATHISSLFERMNGSVLNENGFVKNRAKLFASKSEDEIDCSAAEKQRPPSYVNLSCAVSGYSGLNRYDSKVRQEIKSRESSRDRALPLCMTRSRDPSPSPSKAEFRSRVSMGFILSENKITSSLQTGPTRSKSVDRGFLRQKFLNGCLNNKPPPHSPESNSSTTSCRKSPESALNSNLLSTDSDKRGRGRFRSVTVAQDRGIAQETKKSVIQQRIERLYGPAALARGFFTVKSPQKSAKDQKTR